jgi:tetratricopeptide (TPR) repeat protein
MLRAVSVSLLGAALSMGIAAAAWANASDDGNAGLDALNNGQYEQAIRLFTRALKSGELAGDDKEFAYLNRGKAYIGKHQYKLAIADLKAALALKPDDSDAQSALDEAQSAAPSGGSAHMAAESSSGTGWGLLSEYAGRYFWYQIAGKDPHLAIVRYEWSVPQQVLLYSVRSKSGTMAAGEYKLDPTTNRVVEAEATANATYYGTVSTTRDGTLEFFFVNTIPRKVSATRAPDGSYVNKAQNYVSGAWRDADTVTFVEVSEADAESLGYFKVKKP